MTEEESRKYAGGLSDDLRSAFGGIPDDLLEESEAGSEDRRQCHPGNDDTEGGRVPGRPGGYELQQQELRTEWRLFDVRDLVTLRENAGRKGDKDNRGRDMKLAEKLEQQGGFKSQFFPSFTLPALAQLEEEMPHFRGVIGSIRAAIALAGIRGEPVQISPILLDGAPGIGKSHFAHRLAKALGVPLDEVAMDNSQGGAVLAGSAAHWSNTQTGMVFNLLTSGDHISPVIVLDEIDKAPQHSQYDPLACLHTLLEPENARQFQDASFPLPIDASHVIWIATANDANGLLPPPLLSRFEVHRIDELSEDDRLRIAWRILTKALDELVKKQLLPAPPRIRGPILQRLAQLNPRQQYRVVERMMGELVLRGANCLTLELWPETIRPESQRRRPIGFIQNPE